MSFRKVVINQLSFHGFPSKGFIAHGGFTSEGFTEQWSVEIGLWSMKNQRNCIILKGGNPEHREPLHHISIV